MATYSKEITDILATSTFRKLLDLGNVQIAHLNAAIALLIKANIDYDVTFTSGTRRDAPEAELSIFINPSTTIRFTITFQSGDSFSGGIGI